MSSFGSSVADLADNVVATSTDPLDGLEITALLESKGINDAVARDLFGHADTFELAEAVLARVRSGATVPAMAPAVAIAGGGAATRRSILRDYLRGPQSLLPVAVLLYMISAFRERGQWDENQVLVFSFGMTASMLATNCFVQAMSRRGAIFLSRGDLRAGKAFVGLTLRVAALSVGILAVLFSFAMRMLTALSLEETALFLGSFLALSGVWLLAGALALVGRAGWLVVGLAAGLAASLGLDSVLTPAVGPHFAIASVFGFLVASSVLLEVVRRRLREDGTSAPIAAVLPSTSFLVSEAGPYFYYGLLYMVLIGLPHALGWIGRLPSEVGRLAATSSLEVGLTVSLLPILLAAGVVEHAARRFWIEARDAQRQFSASSRLAFVQQVTAFYGAHGWRYLTILGALSGLVAAGYEVAAANGFVVAVLGDSMDTAAIRFALDTGLLGYWLLGWGLYNSLFTVSLGRPTPAIRALAAGIAALLLVGMPLVVEASYLAAGPAFIVGTFVFGLWSRFEVRTLLAAADYYYYASF